MLLQYTSGFLLILGVFLLLTSTVGFIRFPDFYTRMHAGGVSDSLGLLCCITSVALNSSNLLFASKLLLLIAISWIGSTTSCHALADSCYRNKQKE